MNWKALAERLRTLSVRASIQPDHALLLELASGAVLLAWVAHWALE